MNTINVLSVEEVESILQVERPPTLHLLILNRNDIERTQDFCQKYGYIICRSEIASVVKLVKSGGV